MYSKELKTNFNMAYADLSALSKQQVNTIMRDITEFENYGISAAEIQAFRTKVEELDNMRIDEDYRGLVMEATQSKDALAKPIKSSVREIAFFVKQTYDVQSGSYARLNIGEIGKLSDFKLFRTARSFCRVVRSMNLPLTDAIENKLSELESNYEQFSELINEKDKRVEERDVATLNRVLLANEIYNKFSNYSQLGQVIWAERNEAKYNDYVIYGSSKKKDSSPPENADGSADGSEELPNG